VGFGIDRRARSRKPKSGLRALLGKAPDARDVGERLVRLARRALRGSVVDASAKRVTFALHPGAPPARIAVLPDGDLEIRADTSSVGPGYHSEILVRLAPILDELEYTLEGDESDPQARMAAWLADELRAGTTRIGMPADRSFQIDATVLTAMGPRDAAWRDAVIADPASGADAFAWWDRGPGDEARSRALLAMWFDVPWREPLEADELALMERVDEELTEARRVDRNLALPWPEWAELLGYLGKDNEHAERVRKRAGDKPRTIGYRRHMMDIELAGGWALELGGSFVGRWDDDDERWWATDGQRVVEFTSLTADDAADSDALLAVPPEAHPVIARLSDASRRGRAEAYDTNGVHIVHGLMVSAPQIAIVTFKGNASDEAWALATWRTLRNSS
jgi:hypothetical protein